MTPSQSTPIGLQRHTVRLVEYQPEWADLFATEAADIRRRLVDAVVDVQHVGSTAVPGAVAKPILDIAIAVAAPPAVPLVVARLCDAGYVDRGFAGDNGGHLLVKESAPEVRTVHVHVVAIDDPQWRDYLWFRDTLRADEAIRQAYCDLKRTLAAAHPLDRRAYTAGKERFVRGILSRLAAETARGQPRDEPVDLRLRRNLAAAAVIICDMWDAHHCVSAARRVAEMAPRMNAVVAGLRARGALIIHAPGGCSPFYDDTPARRRAIEAPHAPTTVSIDWNDWGHDEAAALPPSLTAPGACSCDSADPCGERGAPWTRQIPSIEIDLNDAVSDDGQEVFNLLEHRGIADVIVMGVHTNICVLGRPYGIRQLVYLGKKPVLCRDLTDSFHRDPRGHSWGTDQVVAHIERRWCPTVTSDELVGGAPFGFVQPHRGTTGVSPGPAE